MIKFKYSTLIFCKLENPHHYWVDSQAEIDGILAAEFCQDLLASVIEAYESEKARILGKM